jgi:beta-glucuronidase
MMNQYFGSWHGAKDGLPIALDVAHASWPDRPVIVSEYGISPHWYTYSGPVLRDPAQYYSAPEEAAQDSAEADAVRARVVVDQTNVFRSRPFVAGAIFWAYQDYRTRTGFLMGLCDEERNRRGSYHTVCDEYSPVLFEGVSLACSGGTCRATVSLRARGPLGEDMPAYTLREYRLCWEIASRGDGRVLLEAELTLPTLEPGAGWTGEVSWDEPGEEYVLALRVVRPTGFVASERAYTSRGEPLPAWQRTVGSS